MPNHTEILNAKPIAIDAIVGEAKALFEQDYRLVTYSVVDLGDGNVDIIYHFDKDLEFVH